MPKPLFSLNELKQARRLVHQRMAETPQYSWPLLNEHVGTKTWVKHENHTPTGAFKVRGGITFMKWLKETHPEVKGIITATRGNHGQSQARAAQEAGLSAKIFVPQGNSSEKNEAMRAFGAEVIEFGKDFDTAKQEAIRLSEVENLFLVPPFHPELVRGVATYGLELLLNAPDLHTVYVSVGCGSGICGLITARDALGMDTRIVGVVSSEAPAAKQSFEAGTILPASDSAHTFADGVAVREPVPGAFAIYSQGAERMLEVNDDEIAEAMRVFYKTTHNLAEGAGAVALAGLLQEKQAMQGKEVAVILSGANIDLPMFNEVLAHKTPKP